MILLKIVSLLLMSVISAQGQSQGCMGALDIGLSASSMWDANHAPSQGRLLFQETSSKSGAWAAKTNDYNQWLQIDLGTPGAKVTSVATQGRNWNDRWSATPHNQWVTKYKLQYSVDGSVFQDYKEQGQANAKEFVGNADRDTVVSQDLNPLIIGRYIRFVPTAWHNHVSMRVGAYGCPLDIKPPVFTFCPSDILMDDNVHLEVRVYWQKPKAADNSGVIPTLSSNRKPGELFSVPGSYLISYKAVDGSGNEATCEFKIILKKKTCPLYAAPENGALACTKVGVDRVCAVMCNSKFDFETTPPLVYYCSSGQWKFFAVFPFEKILPWPNCSVSYSPSSQRKMSLREFYFNGDANDPSVVEDVKNKFYSLLSSPYIPPIFCVERPWECRKEKMEVFAGNVSS